MSRRMHEVILESDGENPLRCPVCRSPQVKVIPGSSLARDETVTRFLIYSWLYCEDCDKHTIYDAKPIPTSGATSAVIINYYEFNSSTGTTTTWQKK